jgi:hypothetical protein
MKKIKLHLEVAPIVGYLHHAYHLSVAQEHSSFEKWFYANYIQLKYYPKNNWMNFYRIEANEGTVKFDSCPLLEYQIIKNSLIKTSKIGLIDFISNALEQGYFVWLFIDEYYDPNRRSYHKRHFNHETLLYGYDSDSSCFYSVGFDQQQNFTFSEIQYADLLQAFNMVKDELPMRILKPIDKIKHEFDVENVKNILNDYITSDNTSIRNRMINTPTTSDCVYGMDIYKHLKLYLESRLKTISHSDIRIFHIFWEHKKCMLSRIKYLHKNNYLKYYDPIFDTYNEIERKTLTLRNQSFEYNLTGNNDAIGKMIDSIDEIKDNELKILIKLLDSLK